jgi:hypothetical protein
LEAFLDEARGDFKLAANKFSEALTKGQDDWPDREINTSEADLWEESRGVSLDALLVMSCPA